MALTDIGYDYTAYPGTKCTYAYTVETVRGAAGGGTAYIAGFGPTPMVGARNNTIPFYSVGYHKPVILKPGHGEYPFQLQFTPTPSSFALFALGLRTITTPGTDFPPDLPGIDMVTGNNAWSLGILGAVMTDVSISGAERSALQAQVGGQGLGMYAWTPLSPINYSSFTEGPLMAYDGGLALGTYDWSAQLRNFRVNFRITAQPKYAFGANDWVTPASGEGGSPLACPIWGPKWIQETVEEVRLDFNAYESMSIADLNAASPLTPITATLAFTDSWSGNIGSMVALALPDSMEAPAIQVNQTGDYRFSMLCSDVSFAMTPKSS